MAIGKIKRQKQRPCVDRLYNILSKLTDYDFKDKPKIQQLLDDMVERKLLALVPNNKGEDSYRELNSAIAIVAINHPTRSRLHLVPENRKLIIIRIFGSFLFNVFSYSSGLVA